MVGEPGLRAGSHDRGRVLRDLAVMLADGGDCLADLRAVGDQACPLWVHGVAVDRVSGDGLGSRARRACLMLWVMRTLARVRVSGNSPARRNG